MLQLPTTPPYSLPCSPTPTFSNIIAHYLLPFSSLLSPLLPFLALGILPDGLVEYVGQLIALVAARSQTAAEAGAKLVTVAYADIPDQAPILTLEQAIDAGAFYPDNGDAADSSSTSGGGTLPCLKVEAVRSTYTAAAAAAAAAQAPVIPSAERCDYGSSSANVSPRDSSSSSSSGTEPATAPQTVATLIASAPLRLTGRYSLPAQQHMYMETQTAVAEPVEGEGGGAVRVVSATQSLDAVQMAVAGVLGVAYHQVEVVARRLGGG
jgi:xanthine dehydrogenase molybdopterin-binding subunit B